MEPFASSLLLHLKNKKQNKPYPKITEINCEVKGIYLSDGNFSMFSFKVIGKIFILSSHSWLVKSLVTVYVLR